MQKININGLDLIDRRTIEQRYRLSRTMVKNRLDASGIPPLPYFGRYLYPLAEVLEHFDQVFSAK